MQANQIVDVRIESDIYIAGNGEDGPVHATRYFVVVENTKGEIFAHSHAFNDCAPAVTDEGDAYYAHIEAEPKALALARKVHAHIATGAPLDPAHWYYRRAAYGSGAYLRDVSEMTKEQRAQ